MRCGQGTAGVVYGAGRSRRKRGMLGQGREGQTLPHCSHTGQQPLSNPEHCIKPLAILSRPEVRSQLPAMNVCTALMFTPAALKRCAPQAHSTAPCISPSPHSLLPASHPWQCSAAPPPLLP